MSHSTYDIDELETWVTLDSVDRMKEVDPYQAETLTDNPDSTHEVFSFVAEGRAKSFVKGDSLQKGMLPDRFSIAPDVTITVYERDHPRYEYLMTFSVGDEIYTAITFTGDLIEVIEHTLFEIDDSIDGIRNIYNVQTPDPDYNEARDFVEDVDDNLRSSDLKGALYRVIESEE